MDLNKHFKCSEFTHVLKIGTGVTLGHDFLEEKNRTHKICLTPQQNEFSSTYRNGK